ncbi:CHAP domain-containing protein [Subsaxibacter sp. CAU 1640]|uniref:CHAP domain-containing protein n=1 Tax=Subsaxibacter sp. CAU 1640 TaxID=2933271 RepID=UPI002002F4C2|nr:CHAP domain-containing protein [Subsaxibacter sp. CAU 1640]MCK7590443.1 CHAP domain-containing protein [Subsaxibacter sp. CAU 1640]
MKTNYFYIIAIIVFLSCEEKTKSVDSLQLSESLSTTNSSVKIKHYEVENIGDTLDVFNNVVVFYNKSMNNTSGRHLTSDGYNLGLKWQCVEFVKRYYYEHLNHKMPNSYGHAKDFFNGRIADGHLNSERKLVQFSNGSTSKPQIDDLLIFDGNMFNPYGHVAIVSNVEDNFIEIVQQNVGKTSRDKIALKFKGEKWYLNQSDVLGWLRKQ